jgi:hypothetical protein
MFIDASWGHVVEIAVRPIGKPATRKCETSASRDRHVPCRAEFGARGAGSTIVFAYESSQGPPNDVPGYS